VALVAGGVVFLLLRGGGAEASIRLRFEPGQTLRYRLVVDDEGSGEAVDSEYNTRTDARLGLDVRSVDTSGTATTTTSVDDVRVQPKTLEPSDLGSLGDQTVRFAEDGRQLDTIVVIADENGQFFSLVDPFLPFLPQGEVSQGDSWDVDAHQDMAIGTGAATFVGQATLVRLEGADAGQVAVVEADLTETWDLAADARHVSDLGGGPAEESTDTVAWKGTEDIHMTSRVDVAAGSVLSTVLEGDYDLTITSGGGDGQAASSVHNTGTFRQRAELVTS
jgi:hypothetical protein